MMTCISDKEDIEDCDDSEVQVTMMSEASDSDSEGFTLELT